MKIEEIKYRAWDKFNDQYWYSERFDHLSKWFASMEELEAAGNELIFECWTTNKDINKKDIYSGDIVVADRRLTSIQQTTSGFNGVYHNDDGSWDDEWEDNIWSCRDIEVKGDVHKNMDLFL